VRIRLESDVPLGVLLSGGVDSSCVTALAAKLAGADLRTFSIGFEEEDYNELPQAERVASFLNTRHTQKVVRPDAAELLPKLVQHLEEPFADSSALATFCAAELAAKKVTVVLNGDGGDESFAGYVRYRAHRLAACARFLPTRIRNLAAALGQRLCAGQAGSARGLRTKLQRFMAHAAEPAVERYFHWMSTFEEDAIRGLVGDQFPKASPINLFYRAWESAGNVDPLSRLLQIDLSTYLPGDLLVKMDRMCMAWSIEARSPFLDHMLMEFAARIPSHLKLNGFFGAKEILKRAFRNEVPPWFLNQRKAGFGVPIDQWLRTDLRDFAYDVLLGQRGRSRGLLQPEAVRALLDDHASGRANYHHQIWSLLMLELWFREFIDH
jgi:asparagine synthase (glutamine-hydrolysing)